MEDGLILLLKANGLIIIRARSSSPLPAWQGFRSALLPLSPAPLRTTPPPLPPPHPQCQLIKFFRTEGASVHAN